MELEDFKESVEGVLGEGWEEGEGERGEVAGLGSVRDAVEVREEEEEVERDVQEAVNCVKVRETEREREWGPCVPRRSWLRRVTS